MQKIRQSQTGSVLVGIYLISAVLLIFGAALLYITVNESRLSRREAELAQALQTAEAGIEQALFDLREDFINDSSPSWQDGDINGYAIGPSASYYVVPYNFGVTDINDGDFLVRVKNVSGSNAVWIESVGTVGDSHVTIEAYVVMVSLSPWDNAIFAGSGASGAMINGNVDIRGSVHVLGTGLTSSDYAIDLGGTSELVGNNYSGMDATLKSKLPPLPTTSFNGELVETLNAELRVKRGIVGLSGNASVGQPDTTGNSTKETVNASYVTDGFGGSQGTGNVFSDNGWSNGYDLADAVSFPSLADTYGGTTYQNYLYTNGHVISDAAALTKLANITPNSSFSYSGPNGTIAMDGAGNMTVSGIVYIDGGNLNFNKAGSKKTITYSGTGSVFVTGSANINTSLVTNGAASFPNNVIGIMTPNNISFNEAQIDVMGLFYAENTIQVSKQTDITGTIVSNYFDMGTNVPSIYQVPETVNNLPAGMIGQSSVWLLRVVSWERK